MGSEQRVELTWSGDLFDMDHQIERLAAFQADHPEVQVVAPSRTEAGNVFWTATRDDDLLAQQYGLEFLLDQLQDVL